MAGLALAVYLSFRSALAASGEAIFGFIPSLASLRGLLLGITLSWKQLPTLAPPVGTSVEVMAVTYLSAFVAGTLAWRLRRGHCAAATGRCCPKLPAGFGAAHRAASSARTVSSIIPAGAWPAGPLVAPVQLGGDARVTEAMALFPGTAARRLVAQVVDGVIPALLPGAALGVGGAVTTVKVSDRDRTIEFTWLAILSGDCLGVVPGLRLVAVLPGGEDRQEARQRCVGPAHDQLGRAVLRVLAVFLRNLIISLGSVAFLRW